MNHSISNLILQYKIGSSFLNFPSYSKRLRFTMKNSQFSHFSSNFIFSTTKFLSLSIDKSKFANFQSTAISLSSNDELQLNKDYSTFSITQKYDEDSFVEIARSSFHNCYSKEFHGGAIRFTSKSNNVSIIYCNFFQCVTLNANAGGIYVPQFVSMDIAKSCFSNCYSTEMASIIYAASEKKPLTIDQVTFSECGKQTTSYLNYYERTTLAYRKSNTTFCTASVGVFFHHEKPRSIFLSNNFWAYNEGETAFSHPQPVDPSRTETWEFNNIFFNSIKDVIIKGSIEATLSSIAMYGNSFKYFWDVDETSSIHLSDGYFDFRPSKFHNKTESNAHIDYRADTKFDQADISPLPLKVANYDFCFAFKVKKPFTKANNPVVRIQQMGIGNHPHVFVILSLMFVAIFAVVFYLLQRKSEARMGMMRVL